MAPSTDVSRRASPRLSGRAATTLGDSHPAEPLVRPGDRAGAVRCGHGSARAIRRNRAGAKKLRPGAQDALIGGVSWDAGDWRRPHAGRLRSPRANPPWEGTRPVIASRAHYRSIALVGNAPRTRGD